MLALNRRSLAVFLDDEVDTAVRVGPAALGHGIAELRVYNGHQLVKLEPIYGPDLLR